MRFTTKTEYGLICLVYMANLYGKKDVFTSKELVREEHYPKAYIEKIFQSLRRAGVVQTHRGKEGGYSLARDPAQISLKEIIEALEGSTFDVFCETPVREKIVCNHLCICGMKPVWRKTRNLLDNFYHSVTLHMIAKNETLEALQSA